MTTASHANSGRSPNAARSRLYVTAASVRPVEKLQRPFPSVSAAESDTLKLVSQKVRKGYIQVNPANLKITRPKGMRKATESQVARLEKQLNRPLPAEYRDFLLTQNGGTPEPFFVRIPGHPYIDNVGVGRHPGFVRRTRTARTALCAGSYPSSVAKGTSSRLRVIAIFSRYHLPKNRDAVYFWDHEAPDCEDEDEDGKARFKMAHAMLLAGSFNEFLTRISLFNDDG